ncbi:MAG: hypothetical protein ACR2JE_14690 [Acidobacteriaceae bacterium]
MSNWTEIEEPDFLEVTPSDDPMMAQALPKLVQYFEESPEEVFYEGQLTVIFEREFFHWVTARALKELREAGQIGSDLQPLVGNTHIRFYFHRRNRYWKRKAAEIRNLVITFSAQPFTEALGRQGESMVDAGLPRVGFLPQAQNVRTWNNRTWRETGHDLDRVFSRDGLYYGAEIKNRLGYISQAQFEIKLRMCQHLGLIPLFIARAMPKTYNLQVINEGGFVLILGYQLYPYAHRELAQMVHTRLRLPVDCPPRLQDGTLQRFLNWHLKKLHSLPPQP